MQLTPLFQIEARVSSLNFGEMMPSALHWIPPSIANEEAEDVPPEPAGPHPAELALEAAQASHALEVEALKAAIEDARIEGIELGRTQRQPEIDTMSVALGKAIGSLNETAEELEHRCRAEAVDLAVTMAHALIGDAVRHNQVAVLESVLWRAFEHVPPSDEAVIRCHEDDVEVVNSHLPSLAVRRGDLLNLRVVASPAVERGGMLIDFSGGGADAQHTTGLELLRESVESVLACMNDAAFETAAVETRAVESAIEANEDEIKPNTETQLETGNMETESE